MKRQSKKSRISAGYAEMPHEKLEHEHDGFIYCLPAPLLNEGVSFDHVELVFQHYEKETNLGSENERHDFVAMNVENRYDLAIHLHDVNIPEDRVPQHPLTAYIYRKNQRLPLYRLDLRPEDDDYDMSIDRIEFTPGDYFVLVNGATAGHKCIFETEEMAGMTTYHFSVLEHGRNLQHPKLVHKLIGDLALMELTAAEGQLKECDVYRTVCYSNMYRRVFKHECLNSEGVLNVILMDIHWPVDDIYTLVLYHNNEPIIAYRYTLLDKQIYHLTATPLSPDGPIYTLATAIEEHPGCSLFTFEPGFKDVKDYMLNVLSGHEEKGSLIVACEHAPTQEFVNFVLAQLHDFEHYQTIEAGLLISYWREEGAACLEKLLTKDGIRLKGMSELLHPTHQELLTALDRYIGENKHCFYLFENTETVTNLLKRMDCAEKSFSNTHRLLVPDYEPADIVFMVTFKLLHHSFGLLPASLVQLNNLICQNEELFSKLNCENLESWVKHTIVPHIERHQPEFLDDDDDDDDLYFGVKSVEVDFTKIALPEEPVNSMEECLAELNAMVGLETLKSRLKSLFNRTKFDNLRVQQGLTPLNENRQHMIFTGNPGTGKTTVARIMGKVFKQLGVLTEGKVITAERADMVGKYIGHTEDTMKNLLEKAKGNVLFIDEAYSLCDNTHGDRTDYGNRVIESLLGVLANNDSDIIVIMAGYEKQMKQMLEMNPGMKGRFIHTFKFEDYNADELLQICVNKLHSKQFSVDDTVQTVMKACIERTLDGKDELFHNARWAEQFVMQGIVTAMADRLCQEDRPLTPAELCTVTESDVLTGYELTQPEKKKERRRPGFHTI